MNNKALSLSLFMAFAAVYFVYSYVESIEQAARKKFGTDILVVKAKKDIKEQETINETLLEFDVIPKTFLEPAALSFKYSDKESDASKKEASNGIKSIMGHIALVPIKKGEQITFNKVTPPGVRTGLSPQVTPGKRAIGIPVNEVTGVSKLVKPGDRIDVIAVIKPAGRADLSIVKTILQDVVVLSVGRNVSGNDARIVEGDPYGGKERVRSLSEDTSFTSITIEVDAVQAQNIALVLALDSKLSLSLRNNDDSERITVGPTDVNEIMGADSRRIPAGGR